jgi:site-specific recombinase XerD
MTEPSHSTPPVRVRPYAPPDREAVLALASRLTIGVAPWLDAAAMLVAARDGLGRMTEKAVRQIGQKYGYHAMVEDTHPHAFRHSFATELLRKGVPLTAVGALLGHESLQSTARYTQPSA